MTANPKMIPPLAAPESNSASETSPSADLRGDPHATHAAESLASGAPHVWLLRLRALLFVTLCATLGVLLVILPWTPRWTDNPLLLGSSWLRDFVSSGFARGVASGLGLLNLWLGFREAILYNEHPKGSD